MVLRIAAAIAIAIAPSAVRAAQPELAPNRPWVAYFEDNMCILQREYGPAAAPLTLAFKPQPTTTSYTGFVFNPGRRILPGVLSAKFGFGASGERIEKQTLHYYLPKLKSRVAEFAISREELNQTAIGEVVSIDAKPRVNAAFKVPALAKALEVLDECVADLLASWGFSREQQKAIATRAEPMRPLNEYVHPSDYPVAALRNEETGWNSAYYRIDVNGMVSDCKIAEPSGSASLDTTLCRVAKSFRYRPALDHSGKPIPSLGFVRFRWRLA